MLITFWRNSVTRYETIKYLRDNYANIDDAVSSGYASMMVAYDDIHTSCPITMTEGVAITSSTTIYTCNGHKFYVDPILTDDVGDLSCEPLFKGVR